MSMTDSRTWKKPNQHTAGISHTGHGSGSLNTYYQKMNELRRNEKQQYPVATNNNQTNSSGRPPTTPYGKASQILGLIIPAGATLPVPIRGDSFYLVYASGTVNIRPIAQFGPGSFSPYSQGLGLDVPTENSFNSLEVNNPDATNAVFILLFAGFDRLIDNRLVLTDSATFKQIIVPVYSDAVPATSVSVTDKSGTVVTDQNGTSWFAISRVAVEIFNTDATNLLAITNTAATAVIGAVYPLTTLQYAAAGGMNVTKSGGGNVPGVITEIYSAVKQA